MDTLDLLTNQFGPVMTTEEVARVLKFPTVPALRAALRRKRLTLSPIDVGARKQQLFATREVAGCLDSWTSRVVPAGEVGAEASCKETTM